jgi:hypothetical protein
MDRARSYGPASVDGSCAHRPPKQRPGGYEVPPSQSLRVFLDNHVKDIVAIDFFVVPTATFRVLYVFLVMSHARRRILHRPTMTNLEVDPDSENERL